MTKTRLAPGAGRVVGPKIQYRAPELKPANPLRPDGAKRLVGVSVWSRLNQIIEANTSFKPNGRTPYSDQTRHNMRVGLRRLFKVLREAYPIDNPANFDGRHLAYLYDWMRQRYENHLAGTRPSLQPATIAGYVSYLQQFCRWIGQPELRERAGIEPLGAATRRTTVASRDLSWEANGLDVAAKIDEAYAIEPWVGMALLAQAAFGLRRKEALCLAPARAWRGDGLLHITQGAKGGRVRCVPLTEAWQHEVLAALIQWLREERRPKTAIGEGGRGLKSNLNRYNYVLAKIGVTKRTAGTTGHGLRNGFACRLLESFGITPPVRGGQVQLQDREQVERAYLATSEALGHSRPDVVGAYVGARRAKPVAETPPPPPMPDVEAIIERISAHRAVARKIRAAVRDVYGPFPKERAPRRVVTTTGQGQ